MQWPEHSNFSVTSLHQKQTYLQLEAYCTSEFVNNEFCNAPKSAITAVAQVWGRLEVALASTGRIAGSVTFEATASVK